MMKKSTFGAILAFLFAAAGALTAAALYLRRRAKELDAALRAIGLCVQWQAPLQSTRHVFTHRIWQISGFCGTAAGPAPEGCVWASRAELNGEYAVPSAFAGIMRQWRPE